jgi:hypothetical protein
LLEGLTNQCRPTLTATQQTQNGSLVADVVLNGEPMGLVLFARGKPVTAYRRVLESGDKICNDEIDDHLTPLRVPPRAALAYTDPAVTRGAIVINRATNIMFPRGGLFGSVAMAMSAAELVTFNAGALNAKSFDPCNLATGCGPGTGIQQSDQAQFVGGQGGLEGFHRFNRTVSVTGDLVLDSAHVYVNGSITINGALRGRGLLVAKNAIFQKNGEVNLRPVTMGISGPDTVTLFAGQGIILNGQVP